MSHTLNNVLSGNGSFVFVVVTIVNYAIGGETVTQAEILPQSGAAIVGVILGSVPANQNSLGVPLFPVLDAGKIKLFQFTGGSPVEITATVGLNAKVSAMVGLQ